jgi:hypothetical protein
MVFMGAAGATMTSTGAAGITTYPPPPTPLPISGRDAVERVARVLWREQPDDATLAAASAVKTKQDLELMVRPMVADPRATEGVGAFFRWWLGLDDAAALLKDPSLFPDSTPALADDMVNETVTFGTFVTMEMSGSFATLMTAPFSFVDARLAAIYGVGGVTGDALVRVDLPAGQRAGLLTQPALQALGSFATRNSPSHRGLYVDQKFFCISIPAMPPGAPGLAPPAPGQSVRQALNMSTQSAVCETCHVAIDPIGYVFEGFDPMGRGRATDNGVPVDATATVFVQGRADSPWPIYAPADLAFKMAADVGTQDCYAQQWLTFALGRDLVEADQPSLLQIQVRFRTSALDLQTLIVAVLLSDTFLTPSAP